MAVVVRSSDRPEIAASDFNVVAAGVLPWRVSDGALEVLVIHRPRYDDWSWPKGKLEAGEAVPECAVREVLEETGLRVQLGIPLPAVTYTVYAGEKVVYYWAAKAAQGPVAPDGREVDEARWVAPGEARGLLSNPTDLEPLDALAAAHKARDLDTRAFILLRHAKAKPRSGWTREEGKRPLAATGQRQAVAVARLLSVWKPEKVASSPWTRCLQTVAPYLKSAGQGVKLVGEITEHAAKRNPKRAARAFAKLLDGRSSTAVCTHRPVLPTALAEIGSRMPKQVAAFLPDADPYLRPGAGIVLHRPTERRGKVVSVEIYEPYQD